MELTFEEVRVLGCLVEKAANTPEQYPLTTNSLVAACNQKTSREPVVSFTTRQVDEVVMALRLAGLARINAGGRSPKHRHVMDESLGLTTNETIVLSVLMLRGAQSAGELRTRTDRSIGFADVADVEAVLNALAQRDDPLVQDIGRGSGQSQNRWNHLLGDDVDDGSPIEIHAGEPQAGDVRVGDVLVANDASGGVVSAGVVSGDAASERSAAGGSSLVDRVVDLERRLALLEEALGVQAESVVPGQDVRPETESIDGY
jgi:uncharacterized protein YceH (UPF0502 family)